MCTGFKKICNFVTCPRLQLASLISHRLEVKFQLVIQSLACPARLWQLRRLLNSLLKALTYQLEVEITNQVRMATQSLTLVTQPAMLSMVIEGGEPEVVMLLVIPSAMPLRVQKQLLISTKQMTIQVCWKLMTWEIQIALTNLIIKKMRTRPKTFTS